MTAPTVERNLLDLHMSVDPDGSTAAVAPLSWCVTKTLVERVKNFKNPQLIIVNRVPRQVDDYMGGTVTKYDDKWVKVVPVSQGMQYVNFSSPGLNELHVYVIDIPDKDAARMLRRWVMDFGMRRDYDMSSKFDDDGRLSDYDDFADLVLKQESEVLKVNVPKEMFAPPPAKWRARIVNSFFRGKAQDQCHFRKRFIAALAFSVILVPFLYATKTVFTVVAYAFGIRGFDFSQFKNPTGAPDKLWTMSPNTWFAPLENPDHDPRFSVWTIINIVSLAMIGLVVLAFSSMGWGVAGVMVLIAALTAVAIFAGLSYLHSESYRNLVAKRDAAHVEKERIRAQKALSSILCETNLPAMTVKDLPKELQTVELRFSAFKTKVCRPFAR